MKKVIILISVIVIVISVILIKNSIVDPKNKKKDDLALIKTRYVQAYNICEYSTEALKGESDYSDDTNLYWIVNSLLVWKTPSRTYQFYLSSFTLDKKTYKNVQVIAAVENGTINELGYAW